MRVRRIIDKVAKKHVEKSCYFCGNHDYATLQVHRIVPGENGGRYTETNTVVLCSNCHNRVHDGQITIERWYSSTAGKKVLHFWEHGIEKWL